MYPEFWEYFNRPGFSYGHSVKEIDLLARDWLVVLLNKTTAFTQNKIKAFSFNPRVNLCQIVVVEKTPALERRGQLNDTNILKEIDLEKVFELSNGEVEDVLGSTNIDVDELIQKAYTLAQQGKKPNS